MPDEQITLCTAAVLDGVNGTPPREFRIWKAGANPTDKGTHLFTDRSASLLLAQQAQRGNLYSVDVDHLSLSPNAPPEARKAVGWHRLEVRGGELWATNVEWTPAAAAELAGAVPGFRYFSPAYQVDEKTGEIVGYVNTALTNNPATWHVTALANVNLAKVAQPFQAATVGKSTPAGEPRKKVRATMPKMLDDVRAAVAKMVAEGDPEEMAAAARLMAAFEAPSEEPKPEAAPAPEEPKPEAAAAPAAAVAASATADLDARLAAKFEAMAAEIATLKATSVAREREAILATRPDVSAELKAELASETPEKIKRVLAAIKAPTASSVAEQTASATATRGAGEGKGRAISGSAEMRARMGLIETTTATAYDADLGVLQLGVTIPKEVV